MKRPDLSRHRAWLAAAVLALAILAGWWLNRGGEPEEAPAPQPAPAAAPVPPPARTLPPSQRAAAGSAPAARNVDIFAVRTWEPPPAPLTPTGAPAPPQAPPLPFRFMGRIAEPGHAPVFLLLQGDRVLQARIGERVGAAYRLEKLEGGQLHFRYQPMNVVQTLPIGAAP